MLSVVTGNSSNVNDTLPGATASCVPWRTTDVKYANNEVYVDLVEEIDAIINRSISKFTNVLQTSFLMRVLHTSIGYFDFCMYIIICQFR